MAFCNDILEYYLGMDDLQDLRHEINEIDNQIFSLLTQRLNVVNNISMVKKQQSLPVFDKSREDNIYNRIDSSYEGRTGLYLKDIYKTVMNESKRIQKEKLGTQ